MMKTFIEHFIDRLNDAFMATLLRLGIELQGAASLLGACAPPRERSTRRTVPVPVVEQDGQRWLVAPYGGGFATSGPARTATLTHGYHSGTLAGGRECRRRRRSLCSTSTLHCNAPPILRSTSMPRKTHTIEDFEREFQPSRFSIANLA